MHIPDRFSYSSAPLLVHLSRMPMRPTLYVIFLKNSNRQSVFLCACRRHPALQWLFLKFFPCIPLQLLIDCEILEGRDVANQVYIPNAWHAVLNFVKKNNNIIKTLKVYPDHSYLNDEVLLYCGLWWSSIKLTMIIRNFYKVQFENWINSLKQHLQLCYYMCQAAVYIHCFL